MHDKWSQIAEITRTGAAPGLIKLYESDAVAPISNGALSAALASAK